MEPLIEGYSPTGNYNSKTTYSMKNPIQKQPSGPKPATATASAASSNGFKTGGKFK